MAVIEKIEDSKNIIENLEKRDFLIGSGYGQCIETRMKLHKMLSSEYSCEIYPSNRINFNDQINYAKKSNYKFLILTGEKEEKEDLIKLVDLSDMNKEKRIISVCEMMNEIKKIYK
ncbi:hypothetical protein A0H76_1085 [Hepatospora eriocheir]|uniref:Anticodon-binding domain-containing protein n=1 Tax=Hepatospora eriocheir TaxID=1081669 RepID=A0A1X0Q685_9MICR|nr:hypothetical protein A0H76_1085 [Hepatospora eriocheir]